MELQSKKDFQNLLFKILNPVLPHYSEGKARVVLGYTGSSYKEKIAEMEAFARPFWGLTPYFYGGGRNDEFQNNCLQGLKNGTDPQSPEYWGNDFQRNDQRFCEMAALAAGLLMIPEKLWDPLSAGEKDNLAAWLDGVNHYELGNNNWQFFAVLVNVALKKLGRGYDSEVLENSLDAIDSFYLGEGWYRDGVLNNKDYYISFAFHYYGLLYSVFMEDEDPQRCAAFKERAMLFAGQFVYWFDENGEAVPYGRSLTYRFAQAAFFSACLFAGIEPFPVEVMKGILSRHLSRWMESRMFDFSGIMTVGYKYPNLVMAENYNAPGSPLWSLKVFLFLALADDHPFWSAQAAPLPELEPIAVLNKADMIISRDNGSVTMYPAGGRIIPPMLGHMAEKYSKFAYSTKYGFSVQKASDYLNSMAPDSNLVFEVDGHFYTRASVQSFEIGDGTITSVWSPLSGITVTTTITVRANGHVRHHAVSSEFSCKAYDCGFALSTEAGGLTTEADAVHAGVSNHDGECAVSGGEGVLINASPNTSLMFPRTVIPAVSYDISAGENELETTIEFL